MKYIVTMHIPKGGNDFVEEIFIFPESINHDDMMQSLSKIKTRTTGNSWHREYREALSAGFTDGKRCWGRSETLDLDSRGEVDSVLIVE